MTKLMTLDLETNETLIVYKIDTPMAILDIVRVPIQGGFFFIVQLSHSLILVDILKNSF